MIKEMLLVKRKEGLSKEDFVKHYEEVHAPLIMKMCPSVKQYTRNYVQHALTGGEPGFDCITAVWYEDAAGLKALAGIYTLDEGKVIRDSEASFMDESKLVAVLVDEKATT